MLGLLVSLFLAGTLSAQSYRVASVNGDAHCLRAGQWDALTPRETLSTADIVRIGKHSVLSVIDRDGNRLYALKEQEEAPLAEIIEAQRRSALGRFATNFLRALTRGDTEKISHEATVSYKDLNADGAIHAAVVTPDYRSAYPLSMVLVDEQTGAEISGRAPMGRRFFSASPTGEISRCSSMFWTSPRTEAFMTACPSTQAVPCCTCWSRATVRSTSGSIRWSSPNRPEPTSSS